MYCFIYKVVKLKFTRMDSISTSLLHSIQNLLHNKVRLSEKMTLFIANQAIIVITMLRLLLMKGEKYFV